MPWDAFCRKTALDYDSDDARYIEYPPSIQPGCQTAPRRVGQQPYAVGPCAIMCLSSLNDIRFPLPFDATCTLPSCVTGLRPTSAGFGNAGGSYFWSSIGRYPSKSLATLAGALHHQRCIPAVTCRLQASEEMLLHEPDIRP